MSLLPRIFSTLVIVVLLSACGAPSFSIIPTGDKFSDAKDPYGYVGKNNRLSTKSAKGGTHIDSKGVYLDPYAFRDKKTNEVVSVGFFVAHYNFEISDGFRPIERITFLTDKGSRIESHVRFIDSDFSIGNWNTVSKEFNSSYNESGVTEIPLKDFEALATSKWIEVKISGRKRSQTYDRHEVSPSFLSNLKTFYRNKVQK